MYELANNITGHMYVFSFLVLNVTNHFSSAKSLLNYKGNQYFYFRHRMYVSVCAHVCVILDTS